MYVRVKRCIKLLLLLKINGIVENEILKILKQQQTLNS